MKLTFGVIRVVGTIKRMLMIGVLVIVGANVVIDKGVGDANRAAQFAPQMRNIAVGWTETQLTALLRNPDSIDSSTIPGLGTDVDWYFGTFAKIQSVLDDMQQRP